MQLVADILVAARKGALKTHVMYRARLSHKFLEQYVEMLLREGLLEMNENTRKYVTTEKGLHYLNNYLRLKRAVSIVEGRKAKLKQLVGQ